MTRREKAAWTLALLGWIVAVIGIWSANSAPEWVLINTKYGVVRMNPETGYTQRLVGNTWRTVY